MNDIIIKKQNKLNEEENEEGRKDHHQYQNIAVFVGPEGGFTINEIKQMKELNKFQFVSLGKNILRAETAAIVALSSIIMSLE